MTIDSVSAVVCRMSHFVFYTSANSRGRSSVGRAPGLQPGGRRFESDRLHSKRGRTYARGGDR
jgi:hypothetical protein